MPTNAGSTRDLGEIQTLPQLVAYLRTELGWPIEADSFTDLDDFVFDWGADELGIDPANAAKIEYIKQLRPLDRATGQPQGVFFVKFDTRRLPVVALRRVLSKLVVKRRATASAAQRPLWHMRDLVFVSSYGERDERQMSFAYFQERDDDLPTLKVLGWDGLDTPLHLEMVDKELREHLRWPGQGADLEEWRSGWADAFQLEHKEVITTSKALASRLAKVARAIRDRISTALAIESDTWAAYAS